MQKMSDPITIKAQKLIGEQENKDNPAPVSGNEYADRTLCTALDIGENMLKCGGEIHRVEDAISRIGKAYGAVHVEVFTIPSLIVAAVRMKDGTYSSQVRRIYSSSRNLGKLEALNQISREICGKGLTFDEVQARIRELKSRKIHRLPIYLGAILGAGGFTIFFGGSIFDAIGATIIGVLITFIDRMPNPNINQMAHYVISSFIVGVISMLMLRFGMISAADKTIIGAIMLLVPGLALDTALRDLLCGDIISGLFGLIQSLLLAVMIAVGLTVAIVMFGGTV